ncbi:exopolyphosphatase/guanosine-5'-triphosphate,3'-diphosphate pyrophosphatase [Bartonella callosciuri]|uniref:Exopolyphosphatase/guanosine-5'-triphosphate, 3'-diphosphate pyrophosphatase n=1 Tax=Bartonella callosciuri TaxID=686223 RepID=A0A840NM73_9HYPH|nr:Ppx/GppA phosphatase family protein [Bartonella callosciuri]MBB5072970.1 exopolyphosphatase/guanosine-5'-triphosphate,3'-diphosphate pyrophosphatase [Bartonella callosciuri]
MTYIDAQGRLKGRKPVAVIDIGSNSVRLVIYEGLVRSPTVLFNEKVLCGLGQGVAKTGFLEEKSIKMALQTLKRFRVLCQQIGADEVYTLATAAAREAKNGLAFIQNAENILQNKIYLLSGSDEALYSAYGVISTFYQPKGISGDLGGGSLELIDINNSDVGKGITLPLGSLRLQYLSNNDITVAAKIAREQFDKLTVFRKGVAHCFYAVGGTWRNLAKLHMATKDYRLPVMHGYEVEAIEMEGFLRSVASGRIDNIKGISAVSKNRRQLLSYGAIVLIELIQCMGFEKIIFSGAGVREGFLHSRLPQEIRLSDPLIAACTEMAVLRARSPKQAEELIDFTTNAFDVFGISETENECRYRKAACLLADIGWRIHRDYRGNEAANQIALGSYPGISHKGRAYAALAVFFRNTSALIDEESLPIFQLATKSIIKKARILGEIMRIAHLFSASTAGILPHLSWYKKTDHVVLYIPNRYANLLGERPLTRLRKLSKIVKLPLSFEIF